MTSDTTPAVAAIPAPGPPMRAAHGRLELLALRPALFVALRLGRLATA